MVANETNGAEGERKELGAAATDRGSEPANLKPNQPVAKAKDEPAARNQRRSAKATTSATTADAGQAAADPITGKALEHGTGRRSQNRRRSMPWSRRCVAIAGGSPLVIAARWRRSPIWKE